jgi:hypothetical protein
MSALGQKQTFAVQNRMSALPPKADIARAVRGGEIAWRSRVILDLRICSSYQRKLV